MNKKRVFLGIPIQPDIQNEIENCQFGLQDTKWTKKENLHLTLLFLGDITITELEELKEIMDNVKEKPFEISLKKPQIFIKKIDSILWLQAVPDKEILNLRTKILNELDKTNIRYDKSSKQKFTSHVTIARIKKLNYKRLNDYFQTFESFATSIFTVNAFTIFSSILKSDGPIYFPEKRILLR